MTKNTNGHAVKGLLLTMIEHSLAKIADGGVSGGVVLRVAFTDVAMPNERNLTGKAQL